MDIQECPAADLAIINMVVALLKELVSEKFCSLQEQMKMDTNLLASLFDSTIVTGRHTLIENRQYLEAFGLSSPITVGELWTHLLGQIPAESGYAKKWQEVIRTILERGSLSERIISAMHADKSDNQIKNIFKELSTCLAENKMFLP